MIRHSKFLSLNQVRDEHTWAKLLENSMNSGFKYQLRPFSSLSPFGFLQQNPVIATEPQRVKWVIPVSYRH
jgi:hypothetical protein